MFEDIVQLENEIKEFRSNILASKELLKCLDDLTATMKSERETMTRQMSELQTSVEQHTSDNTQKVGASVDRLLAGYEKAADVLAAEVHTGLDNLRQGNTADLARLKDEFVAATEKGEKNLQNISNKYSDFIARLDASSIDHVYEYCTKLEQSINQKFMLLGIGIVITAILSVISIIL